MDGQAELIIQTLEDMLRARIIDFKGNRDKHFPLVLFAHNSSCHSSIVMARHEALYGRICRSSIGWFDVGESSLLGSNLIYMILKKVHIIRDRLKTTYSPQKSSGYHSKRDLEVEECNKVYLKISHMQGVVRFGNKGKLSPRYVGPFKFLQKIGKVACELKFPGELASVHLVFHVLMLNRCITCHESILTIEGLHVREILSYEEVPIKILDRQVKKLCNKEVASVKVLSKTHLL